MPEELYSTIAVVMRYVFIAMILYILLRLVLNAISEYGAGRGQRHAMGGATITIIDAPEEEWLDERYPLFMENTIGSAGKCDVFLPFNTVSRTHAVIYFKNGEFIVYDAGSAAGTYVNGEPADRPQVLYNGDIITVGEISFEFYDGYDYEEYDEEEQV
ncbi:MAG: FHA domain-containing protein [Christensenellales bacterium]|jgi:hypothetical protein